MKYTLLFSITLTSLSAFAQESTVGLRNEFSQISKYTYGKQSGFEGLQSFSTKEVKGSQFYFPSWTAGSLITASNEVMANEYLFLYDKVRQVLFMRPKDSAAVLQADKDKIRGFNLLQNGIHNFEVASNYDPNNKTDFYEVLTKNDSAYTLLKLVKTKSVKFDPSNSANMTKVRDGEMYDEFQDDVTYFVSYKHGLPKNIKLNENSWRKVLATDKRRVEDFINANNDSEKNEDLLVRLITSLNQ